MMTLPPWILSSTLYEGQAIVGTYTLDIAASKANKVMRLARAENYPLNVTIELVFN